MIWLAFVCGVTVGAMVVFLWLAFRLSDEYRRGVEDAANWVSGMSEFCDLSPERVADHIRALLAEGK